MAKFEISFKRSVTKDLRSIPKHAVISVLERIQRLSDDPRGEGCVKLSGYELYRVRLGKYRIVYEIRDTELVVVVIKVSHRSNIYRSL